MEYLDSGIRSNNKAVGHWLSQEVPSEQAHLRIKTGYFTLNGLGGLKGSIDHLVQNNLPITIALGANDKATIKSDVDALYTLIACSRPQAKLCVISCVGGLFHPKVVHLTRTDGSQLAYVGSANVTPAGFNGSNIEAGILIDSRKGDPTNILDEIAASIDEWFVGTKTGVAFISGPATTQQLVTDGILGLVKQTSNAGTGATGAGQSASKMALVPLVKFPSLSAKGPSPTTTGGTQAGTNGTNVAPPGVSGLEILVAEIGAGVRWKQANFPYATMQTYFGVNPTGNGSINLLPVLANGGQSPPVSTQVVNVQSQNYRLELGSVSGIPYPQNGRPIAVFRKTSGGSFRYRVFMPGDPGHAQLNNGLTQNYNGPKRQLKRIVISSAALSAIWSGCPV